MAYIFLIIGFVFLVKGADFFVSGSSSIARFFKIPSFIIGLTIVAFGTSAPEAAVSITAAFKGQNDIALGNVVGSNLFNLLAVVGICALIKPIGVKTSILAKEFPFSILATVALLLMGLDVFFGGGDSNLLSRNEAWVLILFFCIFVFMLVTSALSARKSGEIVDLADEAQSEEAPKKKQPLWKSILLAVVGLAGIIGGGQLVVNSAREIALSFGISESLIGLTIVAIGTSLPELVTSIVAATKGERDIAIVAFGTSMPELAVSVTAALQGANEIAVGNVVGSNIFNILFVLALSAAIHPISFDLNALIDLGILIAVSLLTYVFAIAKKGVNRVEGGILVSLYIGYMVYIILR